jgi:hypothetical protein
MALLKKKTAYWVKLATPEKKYGKEDTQWSIILVVTDAESRKWVKAGYALKDRFLDVAGKEKTVIKLKRDTHWGKSGDPKTPVKVVDTYGQDLDARTIGNGSVVNVQYSVRDYEFEGRKGKSVDLVAVQVVDLVEYKGSTNENAGDEFEFLAREEVDLVDDVELEEDVFE